MEFARIVRAARAVAAAVLLGAVASYAAPPPEIAAAAPYFPENTKGIISVHLTPEVREWMFSSFFINPQIYRKVVTEQADKFAKVTGFNPMEDVEWDVVAISDNPPRPVLVAMTKKDPTKALAALQADAKTAPLLKVEQVKGVSIVHVDQTEFAMLPDKMLVGMAGTLKPILERGGESPTNKTFLEQVANGPFSNAVAYALFAPAPETMQNMAANPNAAKFGGAVLARLKQIVVAMDFKDLSIVLKLDSKDAALVAGDQIKGLVNTGKGMLTGATAKPEVPADANPLEHINPKVLMTRVLAISAADALNAITVTADGEATKVTIPKDKIPVLRSEGSTMMIAIAAAAGGVYGAMHAKGAAGGSATPSRDASGESDEKAQCWANQQRLTAAVELYNSDKKKKAKLEEVADQLVQSQYLEAKPDDPGQPAGSFKNYSTAADGRVTCKVHGSPEAGEPAETKAEPEKASPSPAAPKEDKEDGGSSDSRG